MSSDETSPWLSRLKAGGACYDGLLWARTQPDLNTAWATCTRGDWLLWLLGHTDRSESWSEERKPLVACVLECARLHIRPTDVLANEIAAVLMRWINGYETPTGCKRVYLFLIPTTLASQAAYCAAHTAEWSIYARRVYRVNAEDADCLATLKTCADIVRKHYPLPPNLEN